MKEVDKFTLIIDDIYYFNLTKKNYRRIIGNDMLRYKVTLMLEKIERGGFTRVVDNYLKIEVKE